MKKFRKIISATALVGLLAVLSTTMVFAGPHDGHDHGEGGHEAGFSGDAYTLDTCPVSGSALDGMGGPMSFTHEGRDYKVCCGGCVGKIKKDAAKYNAQIDAAVVKQQMEFYAMETCPVGGGKLGGMGTPVDYVYNNRLVRLCCAGCIKKVDANPDKYIGMLDEAVIKAQLKSYPLKTDVVTGKKLGTKTVNFVSGNRLVRLNSEASIAEFNKNPSKFFAKLDAAS